jgi:hypothetical protein
VKKTKKNLSELFNGIRGIVETPGDQNIDPDTAWFQDLKNRRDLHKQHPNAFAHYSPKTDTPQFPIVNPSGRPCIKTMLRSLAQALAIQAEKPNLPGIDDIIHKLEKIAVDYREDLTEIPEYRVDIVKTADTTNTVNNLIYGPYKPNTTLASLISDLNPKSDLNLGKAGDMKVNTNMADRTVKDIPTHAVNGVEDRVNVVQKSNDADLIAKDIENMLQDVAAKTAELKAYKQREDERNRRQ